MINFFLLVIYIWVCGRVGGIYTFFINLIVKSIETFVVCAVSRIKLLLLLLVIIWRESCCYACLIKHCLKVKDYNYLMTSIFIAFIFQLSERKSIKDDEYLVWNMCEKFRTTAA